MPIGTIILILLASVSLVTAADPVLRDLFPPGGQRGTSVDVSIKGQRLKDADQLVFYKDGLSADTVVVKDKGNASTHIHIAPDCPLGEHVVRVYTKSGLSSARSFWVGAFPNQIEKEGEAQHLGSGNVTINGSITAEDRDIYTFDRKKGERISMELEGLRLGRFPADFALEVRANDGKRLAFSDDSILLKQDPMISIVAPEDGRYEVEVWDMRHEGNAYSHYRLHVGTYPRPTMASPLGGKSGEKQLFTFHGDPLGPIEVTVQLPEKPDPVFPIYVENSPSPIYVSVDDATVAAEKEPNEDRNKLELPVATLPVAFEGVIEGEKDQDWYAFEGKKGEKINAVVHARSLRSPLDAVISLHRKNGKQLKRNDDIGRNPDARFTYTLPSDGTYYLTIRDNMRRNGSDFRYRLTVKKTKPILTAVIPRFQRLRPQFRQVVVVARGNRFATNMRINRSNVKTGVNFRIEGLPSGVTVDAPTIPAAGSQCPVLFEAGPGAPLGVALVDVFADGEAEELGHFDQKIDMVLGRPNKNPWYSTHVSQLAVAVVEEIPFKVFAEGPSAPLVNDGTAYVNVKVVRDPGFEKAIQVRMLALPAGVSSAPTLSIPANKTEAKYALNANAKAREHRWRVGMLGEASSTEGRLMTSTNLADVVVEKPFVKGKLDMAVVDLGQKTKMVCHLEQLKPFEGKARAELVGLPNGSKSRPVEFDENAESIVFDVETTDGASVGKSRNVFCKVFLPNQSGESLHNIAKGGVLRIDPPKKTAKK